ncbi:MAG: hypothetical protein KC547_20540 [Anaerolineae bacterium]|nr:hypothetical protein [Anaerolineae bacterium]
MTPLTWQEYETLRARSVDKDGWGPLRRRGMNAHLTDDELRSRIRERVAEGKPVALLLDEYRRRL